MPPERLVLQRRAREPGKQVVDGPDETHGEPTEQERTGEDGRQPAVAQRTGVEEVGSAELDGQQQAGQCADDEEDRRHPEMGLGQDIGPGTGVDASRSRLCRQPHSQTVVARLLPAVVAERFWPTRCRNPSHPSRTANRQPPTPDHAAVPAVLGDQRPGESRSVG